MTELSSCGFFKKESTNIQKGKLERQTEETRLRCYILRSDRVCVHTLLHGEIFLRGNFMYNCVECEKTFIVSFSRVNNRDDT